MADSGGKFLYCKSVVPFTGDVSGVLGNFLVLGETGKDEGSVIILLLGWKDETLDLEGGGGAGMYWL